MYIAFRIIGLTIAIAAGVASFCAKKITCKMKKREAEPGEIVSFKSYMLLLVILGAVVAIVPEYIASR